MAFYEYGCKDCRLKFQLQKPFSQSKEDAPCPECGQPSKRLLSEFSHFSAIAPGTGAKIRDGAMEKKWNSQRKSEDFDKKNPDPLKRWRKEREKACDKGPEAWTEYANEQKAKETKKETYGENWLGREV